MSSIEPPNELPIDSSSDVRSDNAIAFDYKAFLSQLTMEPGVYRMLDKSGSVIYVGKAKHLKNRVSSYFVKTDLPIKTQVMVKQIRKIEITITNTETEALILENNFIKKWRPRYNVLFRDDKSYPYVLLTKQSYPRLAYHRGKKKEKGEYFGPFPSSGAVRQSMNLVQKLFKVRQCEDANFKNRSRPCLQYQIKRCSGPCVNLISKEDYAQDVKHTQMFFTGKSNLVIDSLKQQMEIASQELAFEKAAQIRDQIVAINAVIAKQVISGVEVDCDVFGLAINAGKVCVSVLFVRQGNVLGNKHFILNYLMNQTPAEILESFVMQFYLADRSIPAEVLINQSDFDAKLVASALSNLANKRIKVGLKVKTFRADWLNLAQKNSEQMLQMELNKRSSDLQRLNALQKVLSLSEPPKTMECFDISHTMGEGTVASCVVFKDGSPENKQYRRFNIQNVKEGDDYAAIEQAVTRRYERLLKENKELPDLVIIDGGKGQLKVAVNALKNLGLDQLTLISVAKGTERKAGMEQIFWPENKVAIVIDADNPGLHLLQHIRDESHRFAIAGHRAKRGKKRNQSWLEQVPGVGPKKRQELLQSFGGLQGIESASLADLKRVSGINNELAEKIYHFIRSK